MTSGSEITVVLGAGASKPYDFPLGSELLNEAKGCSEPPPGTSSATWSAFMDELRMRETEVCSLDDFVFRRGQEKRGDDVDKAVSRFITRAILQAEHQAKSKDSLGADSPLKTLVTSVVDDDGKLSLRGQHVVFKTFNFDRVLESLLVAEYRRKPSLVGKPAADLGERASAAVEHIHGRIQDLGVTEPQSRVEFGEASERTILQSAGRILHTHEIAGRKVLPDKRCSPYSSEIAFLGFGYHEINVAKLLPIQNGTVLERFPSNTVVHCHFHASKRQDIQDQWFQRVGIVETCPEVFVDRLIRGS